LFYVDGKLLTGFGCLHTHSLTITDNCIFTRKKLNKRNSTRFTVFFYSNERGMNNYSVIKAVDQDGASLGILRVWWWTVKPLLSI
jgi:hypothetical protein